MVSAPRRPTPPQGGSSRPAPSGSASRPAQHGGNRPPFRGGGNRPPFRGGRGGRPAPKVISVSGGAAQRGMSARTVEALHASKNAPTAALPMDNIQGNPPKLKVYALGGLEEIGRNCTVFECGDDIVIVDAGLMFPEENMPGVDYIIPNIASLKGKERNIRGVIVSHGHLDHVGGLPFILPRLGFPTIYTAPLTAGIIRNRQEEFGNANQLKFHMVTGKSRIQMGRNFVFEPFHVNHNISDAFGTALYTPYGVILGTGDFKFDFTPADGDPADLIHIASFGSKNVLMLMSDSTNATSPGHQISEKVVGDEIRRTIERATGRVIIGMFSSMLTRMQQVFDAAEPLGRKVLLQGRSLLNNVELAHKLGYMKYKQGTIVEEDEFKRLPDNKAIVVCTGSQGEQNATLMKVANREHKFLSIQPNDLVVFSSSVIPGNERTVQSLKDTLVRQGAKLVDNAMVDIHAGGHAKQEDLKLMLRLTKPRFFMPIHGNRFMLEAHADLAEAVGTPRSNIFVADNGQIVEFDKTGARLTAEFVPSDYVFVDGLGVGDVSEVVLRDRRELAEDGMLVVVCKIDKKTGALVGDPDIISRGFVYQKDPSGLVMRARDFVKKILKDADPKTPALDEYLKTKVRNEVGSFLFKETERRPMILPVLIDV
ncbi:MAG: RNase J family beta-CASP ribonuclease [Patescibacteria group bacterium]|nr:MAG: RNase J family beta-CASP ribonuclease [Patescibacteria group bacterium]